jgi:hypothetical protein
MDGFHKQSFPSHIAYNSHSLVVTQKFILSAGRFIIAHQEPDVAIKIAPCYHLRVLLCF